ncbi:MAG: exosortase/archaeosortase family protein [Arenicella sp.]|jgi:exosortase/archaeosortase family protein
MQNLLRNKAVQFILYAGGLYIVWILLYYFVIKTNTNWDYNLNYNIVELTQKFLNIFNVPTYIDIESDHVVLFMDGLNYRGIWVGDECNGFKLFSIFSIFIIAFPASYKVKLWFVPMGLLIVHIANILRVAALVMIGNHYPEYLDFNHLYTFTIFVYAIIFLLWYWFAKKYALSEDKD